MWCTYLQTTVRWMLELGWPKHKSTSPVEYYVQKEGKSNFQKYPDCYFSHIQNWVWFWQHRTWGNPVTKDYRGLLRFFGEMANLAFEVTRRQIFVSNMEEDVKQYNFGFSLRKQRAIPRRMSPKANRTEMLLPRTVIHMKDWRFDRKDTPPYRWISRRAIFLPLRVS